MRFSSRRKFSWATTVNSEDQQAEMEAKGRDASNRCWEEDEAFVAKDKIAEWLGGMCVLSFSSLWLWLTWSSRPVNKIALRYYMDRFDFGGMRLDVAFR